MINEKVLEKAYDLLTNQGFLLEKTFSSYSNKQLNCKTKDIINPLSKDEFISFVKLHDHNTFGFINLFTSKEVFITRTLFIELYNSFNNDEYKKYIAQNFLNFCHRDYDIPIYILKELNTKNILSTINHFNPFDFKLNVKTLKDFDLLLSEFNISDELKNDFFINFLKKRKQELLSPHSSEDIKNFLLEKYSYDKEKLTPYFNFFYAIKNEFEDIQLDVSELTPKYLCLIRINIKKTENLLYNKNLNFDYIKKCIIDFSQKLSICLNIEEFKHSDFNCDNLDIFFGSNAYHTKESLEQYIINYLKFINKNPDFPKNPSNLDNYFLNLQLISSTTTTNLKKQTNKI